MLHLLNAPTLILTICRKTLWSTSPIHSAVPWRADSRSRPYDRRNVQQRQTTNRTSTNNAYVTPWYN